MAAIDLLKSVSPEAEDLDSPEARRRLGEKVLAAFNYAYAIGARDIAKKLHEVLTEVEAAAGPPSVRPGDPRPAGSRALEQAELWVAYIEARNRYNATRDSRESSKALAALEAMKDAYKRWSFS